MALAAGTQIGFYEIAALIGTGGMGEVYRAVDRKLQRSVAMKILSDEVADAAARRRFQREAELASSLNHPHIVTVHDAGEYEGRQYLVTEYVDGGTLKDWARQEKRTWRQIVELLTGVADALAAAHAAEILHRDIKPANILITKTGYAKLADFGLAKLTEAAPGEATRTMTEAETQGGAIVGTVAYMSPEQASGRVLDARSDIFSFGVVLHELVSGSRLYAGATGLELLQKVIHEPARELGEDVPEPLRAVVRKTLEKDPAERYQTVRDLVVDLRRLVRQADAPASTSAIKIPAKPNRTKPFAIAAVVLAGLLGVGIGGWKFRPRPAASSPIRSIAVLPLENLSGDPSQEYFSDGTTEELIASLAQIRALRVISRTSVMHYKGAAKPTIPVIGRELGADAIIEGSVRRSGSRVRVTAQLIRASTDTHLWAKDFDREISDVLKLEGEVAQAIAQEVQVALTPEESSRLTTTRRIDPAAQDEYLRGRIYYWRNNDADYEKAAQYFQQALRIQPDYPDAQAALALSLTNGTSRLKEARIEAEKAIGLDSNLAEAHAALATVLAAEWNWTQADREFRRSVELNPNSLDACGCYTLFLTTLGRHAEALSMAEHAELVNPLSSVIHFVHGTALFRAGRYPEAEPHLKKALELEPGNLAATVVLSLNYDVEGKASQAVTLLDRPEFRGSALMALAYAKAGRLADARKLVQSSDPKSDFYATALVYFALGDKDQGWRLLGRALESHEGLAPNFKFDPMLEPYRSDPRFQALANRLNFPN